MPLSVEPRMHRLTLEDIRMRVVRAALTYYLVVHQYDALAPIIKEALSSVEDVLAD